MLIAPPTSLMLTFTWSISVFSATVLFSISVFTAVNSFLSIEKSLARAFFSSDFITFEMSVFRERRMSDFKPSTSISPEAGEGHFSWALGSTLVRGGIRPYFWGSSISKFLQLRVHQGTAVDLFHYRMEFSNSLLLYEKDYTLCFSVKIKV